MEDTSPGGDSPGNACESPRPQDDYDDDDDDDDDDVLRRRRPTLTSERGYLTFI